jgi:hypothetical protein
MPHRWGWPIFATRYPATIYNDTKTPKTLEADAKLLPAGKAQKAGTIYRLADWMALARSKHDRNDVRLDAA